MQVLYTCPLSRHSPAPACRNTPLGIILPSNTTVSVKQSVRSLFERLDHPPTILSMVFILAALETTILPIPFELMLIPLLLRQRRLIWPIILAALAGCMLGSLVGYAIGMFAFQSFGQPLLDWLGAGDGAGVFKQRLEDNAFWTIFLVGFTPVPVQVATLGGGFMEISLAKFVIAMFMARSLRFAGLGLMVYLFGDNVVSVLQRYRSRALIVGLILIGIVIFLLIGPEGSQIARQS